MSGRFNRNYRSCSPGERSASRMVLDSRKDKNAQNVARRGILRRPGGYKQDSADSVYNCSRSLRRGHARETVLEGASVTMGLEQTVVFSTHAVPGWRQVQDLLASRGFPLQIRMINDQLAFPDEMPEEPWRELRVATAADMVTLRRGPDRVTLVT